MMNVEQSVECLAVESEYSEENLPQCRTVYHKSHITCPIASSYGNGRHVHMVSIPQKEVRYVWGYSQWLAELILLCECHFDSVACNGCFVEFPWLVRSEADGWTSCLGRTERGGSCMRTSISSYLYSLETWQGGKRVAAAVGRDGVTASRMSNEEDTWRAQHKSVLS
jgi:hypothetical protein